MAKLQPTALALLLAAVLLVPATASAADDSTGTPTAPAATAEQIGQWIRDLDSDNFNDRQDASTKLVEAGKAAIGPVAEAAGGDSLEVSTRAIAVLKSLHGVDDKGTSQAAEEALKKLTKSENRNVARRAAQALEPEAEQPAQLPFGGGGAIQIQVQAQNINGNRNVKVNADGKQIEIEHPQGGGITMKVTEKVDGKEKTSTYKAQDDADLKKNHPEAYKLYEKYAGKQQAVVIGNVQINGQAIPLRLPVRGRNLIKEQQQAAEDLETAQKHLKQVTERLKELAKEGASADEVEKLAREVEQAVGKIEEAHKRLAR